MSRTCNEFVGTLIIKRDGFAAYGLPMSELVVIPDLGAHVLGLCPVGAGRDR
jgi:hypothetical protein